MATTYTSCAAQVAANIAKNCNTPLTGGYTGRGVLIALADAPTVTQSGANPRTISAVALATGKKSVVIDNVFSTSPFNGSASQSNADDGMIKHRKTVVIQVPLRGSDVSKNIVEPLYQSPLGYMAILEKKDRSGNGSYEVIGFEQGLVANEDGIVRNEYENGGCVVATMSCNEAVFEYSFFDTDYATTKAAFETLMAASY